MNAINPTDLGPLIGFAVWAVILVLLLGVARGRSGRAANSFKPYGDTEQLDAYSRAHANTVENLPIFAVLYLGAFWTGAAAPVMAIGWAVLGARIVQSITHIISRSPGAVGLRAAMQLVQIASFLWLGVAALLALYA